MRFQLEKQVQNVHQEQDDTGSATDFQNSTVCFGAVGVVERGRDSGLWTMLVQFECSTIDSKETHWKQQAGNTQTQQAGTHLSNCAVVDLLTEA